MNEAWRDRLSEYVDDELSAQERREIEAKLADDPASAALVEDLRAIRSEASTLGDREPEGDLWSGIEAAITAREGRSHAPRLAAVPAPRRRSGFSGGQLAAAAAVLVMLTAGVSALVTRSLVTGEAGGAASTEQLAQNDTPGAESAPIGENAGAGDEPATGGPAPGPADRGSVRGPALDDVIRMVGFGSRQRYDASVARLENLYRQNKAVLDSTTAATLDRNLAIADRVIFQARSALEDNPGDPYLSAHLAKAMRHKVKLLKRMARISQDAL